MSSPQDATGHSILVLSSSYPRWPGDSAGHFVQNEVHQLLAQGHRVTVFAGGSPVAEARAPGQEAPDLRARSPRETVRFWGASAVFDHPGALARLAERPWRALALALPLAHSLWLRWWQAEHFDRMIAHFALPSAFPIAGLVNRNKVPLQVVFHGSDLRLLLRLPIPLRACIFRQLSRPHVSLRLVSHEQKRKLLQSNLSSAFLEKVQQAQVQPSPLGLEPERCPSQARALLGLPSQARLAVVVGRLVASKRTELALGAAALVPNLKVVVVGDGPLRDELRAQFPAARFVGQLARDEALRWISAADLLLCSSLHEGAPTAIREARALDVAVVTSDVGDVKRWAKSDEDIWVV